MRNYDVIGIPRSEKRDSDTGVTMVTVALLTLANRQKQPKGPSSGGWLNKMWCLKAMAYYLVIKEIKF